MGQHLLGGLEIGYWAFLHETTAEFQICGFFLN